MTGASTPNGPGPRAGRCCGLERRHARCPLTHLEKGQQRHERGREALGLLRWLEAACGLQIGLEARVELGDLLQVGEDGVVHLRAERAA
eukprot:6493750-Prymnesium_polylepis.1